MGRIGGRGSNGLPPEQVVGLRLHASHAMVPPPIRVGLVYGRAGHLASGYRPTGAVRFCSQPLRLDAWLQVFDL